MTDSARIDLCVETICNRGCRQVREVIASLERGEAVPGAEALSPEERARVLRELKNIMAVYGDSCRI